MRDAEAEADAAADREMATVRADPTEVPEKTEENKMRTTEEKEESPEEMMTVNPEDVAVATEVKALEARTVL